MVTASSFTHLSSLHPRDIILQVSPGFYPLTTGHRHPLQTPRYLHGLPFLVHLTPACIHPQQHLLYIAPCHHPHQSHLARCHRSSLRNHSSRTLNLCEQVKSSIGIISRGAVRFLELPTMGVRVGPTPFFLTGDEPVHRHRVVWELRRGPENEFW